MATTSPDTFKSIDPSAAATQTLDRLGNEAKATVEKFNNALTQYNDTHDGQDVPLLQIDEKGDIDNESKQKTLEVLAKLAGVRPEQLTITAGAEDGISPQEADTPIEKLANAGGHIIKFDGIRDAVQTRSEVDHKYDPNVRKPGLPNVREAEGRLNRANEILDGL
jgi:hypothetical protein